MGDAGVVAEVLKGRSASASTRSIKRSGDTKTGSTVNIDVQMTGNPVTGIGQGEDTTDMTATTTRAGVKTTIMTESIASVVMKTNETDQVGGDNGTIAKMTVQEMIARKIDANIEPMTDLVGPRDTIVTSKRRTITETAIIAAIQATVLVEAINDKRATMAQTGVKSR